MSRTLLMLLAATTFAGCAGARSATPVPVARSGVGATLTVENDRWFEMRIYAEGAIGARQLIGVVAPKSRTRFTLPPHLAESQESLRLIADPRGSSQQIISDPLDMTRGHNVEWQLRRTGTSRLRVM